jgi:hypothetical protein
VSPGSNDTHRQLWRAAGLRSTSNRDLNGRAWALRERASRQHPANCAMHACGIRLHVRNKSAWSPGKLTRPSQRFSVRVRSDLISPLEKAPSLMRQCCFASVLMVATQGRLPDDALHNDRRVAIGVCAHVTSTRDSLLNHSWSSELLPAEPALFSRCAEHDAMVYSRGVRLAFVAKAHAGTDELRCRRHNAPLTHADTWLSGSSKLLHAAANSTPLDNNARQHRDNPPHT